MKDYSVVVQGSIHPDFTPKCLDSIRKYLPNVYIILSTWVGEDVTGLDFDEVIFSRDPDAIARMYDNKKNINNNLNNINRQIVSTINGLRRVKTKYVLKMRTDFEIRHAGFLTVYDKFPKYIDDFHVFEKRIVVVLGDKPTERPFFPYDFLFYGLTKDVLNLFDIPLMTKEDAEWFYTHTPVNEERYGFIQGLFKYIPEQHIWMNCLAKKYPEIWDIMKDCSDTNLKSIEVGEKSFASNLICLDFSQYGIYPLKDSLQWLYKEKRFHMFSYSEWLILYKKYCDKNISLPFKVDLLYEIQQNNDFNKLKKHYIRLVYPIKTIIKYCENLLSTIYYTIKMLFYLFKYVYKFLLMKKN